MLSNAGSVIGQGWAFALREGLDQTGALVGPLAVGAILFIRSGAFRLAYAWLIVPAMLSLIVFLEVGKVRLSWGGVRSVDSDRWPRTVPSRQTHRAGL